MRLLGRPSNLDDASRSRCMMETQCPISCCPHIVSDTLPRSRRWSRPWMMCASHPSYLVAADGYSSAGPALKTMACTGRPAMRSCFTADVHPSLSQSSQSARRMAARSACLSRSPSIRTSSTTLNPGAPALSALAASPPPPPWRSRIVSSADSSSAGSPSTSAPSSTFAIVDWGSEGSTGSAPSTPPCSPSPWPCEERVSTRAAFTAASVDRPSMETRATL